MYTTTFSVLISSYPCFFFLYYSEGNLGICRVYMGINECDCSSHRAQDLEIISQTWAWSFSFGVAFVIMTIIMK